MTVFNPGKEEDVEFQYDTGTLRVASGSRSHSEDQDSSTAELAKNLCPQFVPLEQFQQTFDASIQELGTSNDCVVANVDSPEGSYHLRLLSNGSGVVATCIGKQKWGEGANVKLETLSPRELQVLELLVSGLSNKQIAGSLYLSRRTVEKHRASIHRKTQTRSLALLTRLWIESTFGVCVTSPADAPGTPAPTQGPHVEWPAVTEPQAESSEPRAVQHQSFHQG